MKPTLIVLVVGLLAVGCGKPEQPVNTYENKKRVGFLSHRTEAKPVKEPTPEQKQKALRDSVVGEYEGKSGNTSKLVFLENGVLEAYNNGEKTNVDAKWTIKNGEVVITAPVVTTAETGGKTKVVNESVRQFSLTIKSNGDLVPKIEDAPQTPNAVNVKREVFTYKRIKPSTPVKPTTKQTTVQAEESAESDGPVQITVLTPETLRRNGSGFYPVEVIIESNNTTLRDETIKTTVLVGTNAYPMRKTPLLTNRLETLVPIGMKVNELNYRIKADWQFNDTAIPRSGSKTTGPFRLMIKD